MGLAVNDSPEIGQLINEYWWSLPPELQERVDRPKTTFLYATSAP